MSLADRLLREVDSNVVGELLRDLTFLGEGYGCYSNFSVRSGARKWYPRQRRDWWQALGVDEECLDEVAFLGEGYTFDLDGYLIDVCWFWDGDGTLTFCVSREADVLRTLYNGDCKKDYGWRDDAFDALPFPPRVAA